MIREYEVGLVINPDLSEEQIEAQLVRVGNAIETRGGEIKRVDRWGRRRLAYPIERHRDGYYTFMDVRMESNTVRDVEQVMRVQEDIMRHLITVLDPRTIAERIRRQEQEAARAAAAAAAAQARAEQEAARAAEMVAAPSETVEAVADEPATPEVVAPEAEVEVEAPAVATTDDDATPANED